MKEHTPAITDIDAVVASLSPGEARLFHRIFRTSTAVGRLRPPQDMVPWIEAHMGAVSEVEEQHIVKVTNMVTFEGTLYNGLRARRPIEAQGCEAPDDSRLSHCGPGDPLQHPRATTPEDIFGRVEGRHCLTASNVAKYDGLHGMVVFNEHNPLTLSRDRIVDYIDTGWKWAERAHRTDPQARYFLFIWNCLWRAGASLIHGHAQVMLGRDIHYAKVEGLRRAAAGYRAQYGSRYFDDLYHVHASLGLGMERDGVRVLAYLAPLKDNEVMLMAPSLDLTFKERLYEVLDFLCRRWGVSSFNLALVTPPLGEGDEGWEGFPVLARIVDRGDLQVVASDMGAMELYAASVVASDPFPLARLLTQSLGDSPARR